MLAALVAARRLAGRERRDQPPRERFFRVLRIGRRGLLEHARACEHVAGDRAGRAGNMPAPVDASRAGVRRGAALRVHDVELPMIASGICGDQGPDRFGGGFALAQQRQAVDAEERVDQRLGRDCADPRGDVRHQRPDREEFRRDRNAEFSGIFVAGDDRPGQEISPRAGAVQFGPERAGIAIPPPLAGEGWGGGGERPACNQSTCAQSRQGRSPDRARGAGPQSGAVSGAPKR